MFLNVDTFHAYCVGVFRIYLHARFHMPSSNNTLVNIKLIAKEGFLTAAMPLFYILQIEIFQS
jgi:hypothetical protein